MDSGNAHGTRLGATIDKDTLTELSFSRVGETQSDEHGVLWHVEHNGIDGKTRWTIMYQLVIRQDDSTELFSFMYEIAAGESNVDFWGEYDDTITLTQTFAKQITVTTYE
jgi:hypothetical protein